MGSLTSLRCVFRWIQSWEWNINSIWMEYEWIFSCCFWIYLKIWDNHGGILKLLGIQWECHWILICLVVWNMAFIFPYIGEYIFPNWRSHIFQRAQRAQPPVDIASVISSIGREIHELFFERFLVAKIVERNHWSMGFSMNKSISR